MIFRLAPTLTHSKTSSLEAEQQAQVSLLHSSSCQVRWLHGVEIAHQKTASSNTSPETLAIRPPRLCSMSSPTPTASTQGARHRSQHQPRLARKGMENPFNLQAVPGLEKSHATVEIPLGEQTHTLTNIICQWTMWVDALYTHTLRILWKALVVHLIIESIAWNQSVVFSEISHSYDQVDPRSSLKRSRYWCWQSFVGCSLLLVIHLS